MKRVFITSAVLCGMMASLSMANTVWNPIANGIAPPAVGNWGDPANWTAGVPDIVGGGGDTKGVFNVPGAAEAQITDLQSFQDLVQGDGNYGSTIRITSTGTMDAQGGWTGIGYNNVATFVVETGGVADLTGHLWTGIYTGADATLDISGTLNVGGNLGMGTINASAPGGGTATLNVLDGGVLHLDHWNGDGSGSIQPGSVIDIQGSGYLMINDHRVSQAEAYIGNNRITGNGITGLDAFEITTTTGPDRTYIHALAIAIPEPSSLVLMALVGLGFITWRRLK